MNNKMLLWLVAIIMSCVVAIAVLIMSTVTLLYVSVIVAVLSTLGPLYLTYLIWHHVHLRHLERAKLAAEVRHQESLTWQAEQSLLHNQQMERDRLILEANRHILPPGHRSIIVDSVHGYIQFDNPNHHSVRQIKPAQEDETTISELPTNVLYDDIRHLIPRSHILVGMRSDGVDTKEEGVGACVWIVGLSGTGKTTTTVLRVEERSEKEHLFLGIDPHWFKPDSLTNAVVGYAHKFIKPMARHEDEIADILHTFHNEFKARKAGQRSQPWQKITLIIDEVGSLMDTTDEIEEENAKLIKSIARICGQEARNFNMGGIFISQQATGLAWLRKLALMVIVHQLLMMSERLIACNGNAEVARDMDIWPIGRTYVYGVGFQDGPRTVQQPYIKVSTGRTIDAIADASSDADLEAISEHLLTRQYEKEITQNTQKIQGYMTRQTGPLSGVVEQLEGTSDGRDFPHLDREQEVQFRALYRVRQNIDFCLSKVGGSSRHREHARAIIADMKARGEV